jgi:hypothetical protein
MSTLITTKSSAITSIVFDKENNQVIFTFTSNPDKPYVYTVMDNQFDNVTHSFNTTSIGKTYHELVNKGVITPLIA